MKVGLLQLNVGSDPATNLVTTLALVDDAVRQGAEFVLTPEITNCMTFDRSYQRTILHRPDTDPTLAALREAARRHRIWLLIGSISVLTEDAEGRFANRSFLIAPDGTIAATYDKIHMFDVTVSETEVYRESAGYRPGDRAVLADTPWGRVGMAICYDLRFPHLFRQLAQAGASFLTIPAAFTATTGAAHWHVLMRARAIETGCFVLAPAQTGSHRVSADRTVQTFGHSLVVAPWGEVVLDAGTEVGAHVADIDPEDVARARARVPAWQHEPGWTAP